MSRKGTLTLTCDRCKETTVVVTVGGLVRAIDGIPVNKISVYPPMEWSGWWFVDGEGDVCPDCQTDTEKQKVARYVSG